MRQPGSWAPLSRTHLPAAQRIQRCQARVGVQLVRHTLIDIHHRQRQQRLRAGVQIARCPCCCLHCRWLPLALTFPSTFWKLGA